ncbi:MAG TPA: class I adenylate-forming enzyme family protein [Polyangiaceae bacterium]
MTREPTVAEGTGALHVFRALANQAPLAPFLRVDNTELTREAFLDEVSAWAGALARQGIGANDQVALILPNGVEWCIAFWAIVSLGALPVPLDPQIGEWELHGVLPILKIRLCLSITRFRSAEVASNLLSWASRCAEPMCLVVLDGGALPGALTRDEFLAGAPALPVPSRSVSNGEWLMLACTSGTTGNPKIIAVPHLGFLRAQLDMANALDLSENDRVLLGMPLYHQGGFGMGLQALVAGGQAIYSSSFDPERFLRCLEDAHVTVAQLSATLAKILLTHPTFDGFDLSSLRLYYFAGEVLPDALAAEFWRVRKTRVINVIGSTETATMVMWDSERDSARSASEFRALPFTATRIECSGNEPGNLWIHTDALLALYYANEPETRRRLVDHDGRRWFDTGDLAFPLQDGYIRFVGRAKRVIKRGPNLVHPEELEAFFLTHPNIAGVAVVPQDHELFGESILAWVQPRKGTSLSRSDLLTFCRGKIAAYKVPDSFAITDELPIDIGKIQYKRIATS